MYTNYEVTLDTYMQRATVSSADIFTERYQLWQYYRLSRFCILLLALHKSCEVDEELDNEFIGQSIDLVTCANRMSQKAHALWNGRDTDVATYLASLNHSD